METLMDQEKADIEFLTSSVGKTSQLSNRMVSVLESFDQRLLNLESAILPIHSTTQKLTRVHDNMNHSLSLIQSVLGYFDTASKEEPLLAKGPQESNLTTFIDSIERIKVALLYFQKVKMKNTERNVTQLKSLLTRSIVRIENLFKKILMESSPPDTVDPLALLQLDMRLSMPQDITADPTASSPKSIRRRRPRGMTTNSLSLKAQTDSVYTNEEEMEAFASMFSIPLANLHHLSDLGRYLISFESENELFGGSPPTNFLKAVVDIRSSFLVRIFQQQFSASKASVLDKVKVPGTPVAVGALSTVNQDSAPSTGYYIRGSCPFLNYTCSLLFMIYHEWVFLHHVIVNILDIASGRGALAKRQTLVANTFESTISPAFEQYRDCMDAIMTRFKKNPTQTSDFNMTFLLLDILDTYLVQYDVSQSGHIVEWQEAMKNANKRLEDFQRLVGDVVAASCRCCSDFLEDLKSNFSKSMSTLPEDGTVHEISSNTLIYLKRLCDFGDAIETLFQVTQNGTSTTWDYQLSATDYQTLPSRLIAARKMTLSRSRLLKPKLEGDSSKNISSADSLNSDTKSKSEPDTQLKHYISDVIMALISNLESKSRGYKKVSTAVDKSGGKTILACVFLLNNYHYILKSMKAFPALMNILGKDIVLKVERKIKEEMDYYQQSWKPYIAYLMDTTYIKNGTVSAQLTKAEKQVIKDRFESFNTDFEETHKSQTSYVIPDTELRSLVLKDVKQLLIPMYQRFWDRYNVIQFSEHPEKYLKYDPGTVERMLNKFFDPHSTK